MLPTFQVGLALPGRRCLVVGGGAGAEERVERLLEAQAEVVVVASTLCQALASRAAEGQIEHRPRPFELGDLDGCFLVLFCDDDATLGAAVAAEARIRGV